MGLLFIILTDTASFKFGRLVVSQESCGDTQHHRQHLCGTVVESRQTFSVLCSACSGWVTTYIKLAPIHPFTLTKSHTQPISRNSLRLMPQLRRGKDILHCVSKKVPTFKLSATSSNLNRFSKFLHCWKAYEIC